jgi:homoaconitase/3-isopropylmalate dehydratase large subunit
MSTKCPAMAAAAAIEGHFIDVRKLGALAGAGR